MHSMVEGQAQLIGAPSIKKSTLPPEHQPLIGKDRLAGLVGEAVPLSNVTRIHMRLPTGDKPPPARIAKIGRPDKELARRIIGRRVEVSEFMTRNHPRGSPAREDISAPLTRSAARPPRRVRAMGSLGARRACAGCAGEAARAGGYRDLGGVGKGTTNGPEQVK